MIRNVTVTALCALALVACNAGEGDPAAPAVPAVPEVPVETAGANDTKSPKAPEAPAAGDESATVVETDFSYAYTSDDYILKATVREEVHTFDKDLARALMLSARGELETFRLSSADLREEGKRPFEADIDVAASAVSGDLISIETGTYTDSGGAHPYAWATSDIYRRGEQAPMSINAFISNTDDLKAKVIDALVEEKIERGYAATERDMIIGELNDALAGDDTWMTNVGFVKSTQVGKFGGLQVLFSPYEIGSYAEGPYGPVISASALKGMLKADKAVLFGGEPVVDE